jgi:hypothetical protein
MKTLILTLILTLLSANFSQTEAQTNQQFKLRVNNQKIIGGGKLKIKFLSVVEDSRCPEGVNCIQAGTAKIQISVSKGRGAAKTFEINTDLQPNIVSFEGYDIKFTDLVPRPKDNIRIDRNGYTATFVVSKSGNSK